MHSLSEVSVNDSGQKAVGIELYPNQTAKAEPFASLFTIKPEVLAASEVDIEASGFDPLKPVNVWKKSDGTRVLIDGYTRVPAAEELGVLLVTAYENPFDCLLYPCPARPSQSAVTIVRRVLK